MLKYIAYIFGSVLALAILVSGACAPPAYAASASVVLVQIQAGGVGAALQELVVLYNNSEEEVDITDWCLKNKSNVAFACVSSGAINERIILPPYSFATVASSALATFLDFQGFSTVYTAPNQSSGGIVGGNDSISLVDPSGVTIDSHAWTTSLVGGMSFVRSVAMYEPYLYLDTDSAGDWQVQNVLFIPDDLTVRRVIEIEDVCPNVEGIQADVPSGYELGVDGWCYSLPYELELSEILPNAAGSDEGNEFIEIYNPGDETVDLASYVLWVGPALDKSFRFPEGASIAPKSYLSFSNSDIGYSLLNTSSSVRVTRTDIIIDESPAYQDPAENQAWAFIDGQWKYTSYPTPGAENAAAGSNVDDKVVDEDAITSTVKPCADNQYRSPETNRCRLITTSQGTVTPCKENQYRSEETNRCRNIATETGPAPCAEDQERNPETNRCRNIKKISNADYAVLGVQTTNDGNNWYVWLAIGGILIIILAYIVWEWRYEIGKLFYRIRAAVFARVRK